MATVLACLLLHPVATVGQTTGITTGAITGRVTDPTGAVLPNIAVTIAGPALIGAQATVTDAEGVYWFPNLPPGEYALEFSGRGFRTVTHSAIKVPLGFTATIDVQMPIATLSENVMVLAGSPVIDRQATTMATTFDGTQLANLPGSRSMGTLLSATPGVFMTRFDVGGSSALSVGQFSAYGTAGFNRPTIEGIVVTNLNAIGFALDYGTFDSVSVGVGAYGAEYPSPGIHMQFTVKSGGNQYHGTMYADYEHKDWQSHNIDADQIARGAMGGFGVSAADANRLWSYHDVNADTGGYLKKDRLWWYASILDQRVAARQVMFPVRPFETRVDDYGGKLTFRANDSHRIILFGQAGRNHQPNRLDGFLRPMTAINTAEDSTLDQRARASVWKIEWDALLAHRVFLEVRAGQFVGRVPEVPNGTAPRFEDASTLLVRGANRDWRQDLRRDELFTSIAHVKNGWIGSHRFKYGLEVQRVMTTDRWNRAYPGDVLHVLQSGQPLEVYLFQTPSESTSGLWWGSAYASDNWQARSGLTVNLGLHLDRFRVFLPEQTHPAGRFNPVPRSFAAVPNLIAWNALAPRLGVNQRVTRDGRAWLKLSFARYWLAPGTEFGAAANPNSRDWWQRFRWTDVNRNGVWDRGEEFDLLDTSGGEESSVSLDRELKLPFVREVTAHVQRELAANMSVETGLVWRGERQQYAAQDTRRPFTAFTVERAILDPGPDGHTGTPDDGRMITFYDLPGAPTGVEHDLVANVPNSNSDYVTWEVVAQKRFSAQWSIVASFSHIWNRDQDSGYFGQAVRDDVYPLTPNDLLNTGAGGRHQFRIWTAKVHGTLRAPWNIWITPFLRHQSGQPFGRTFVVPLSYGNVRTLAEPVGTRRMDNVTLLDVRVEKGFGLGGGRRVASFVDVYNVFNANPEQNTNWSSGPSFLRPISIVPPRIARVGMRLDW